MIKNIFIPERIDSFYVFAKTIVAFDIGTTEIYATVSQAKGRTRAIQKVVSERIETDSMLSSDERIIQSLKALSAKLGHYDEIAYALPCSLVIFKELSLPFTGLQKIKTVVPFEVESLLPFSLDAAIVDSIVTKEEENHTELLVAAVKREHIDNAIKLFAAANLPLHRISVDMFELYGLYKKVIVSNEQKIVALADVGYYSSRIAVIVDGQLKYIRSLPKGLVTVAKKLSTLNAQDTNENLQHLLGFGLSESGDQPFTSQAREALEELISEIIFSIEAYTKKLKANTSLAQLYIAGSAADIPHIAEFARTIAQVETYLFQPKQLVHNSIIASKVTMLPNSFIISIATALAPEVTQEFNLQQEEVLKEQDRTINYQLGTLALLTALIFFSFLLYSFLRIRNLRLAHKAAETEALTELKKNFNLKPSQSVNLTAANSAAANELKKQETAWHRLSTENRSAFLRHLAELSRCINLKETQLVLTSISFKEDTIKLYGSVPGYQQLTKLQNGLECPLFKKLPKLQDWNFKSDPITLTINPEEQ